MRLLLNLSFLEGSFGALFCGLCMDVKIVGVAGGTASGKTTFVRRVVEGSRGRAGAVCLDWYYRSNDHLSPAARSSINYDHPNVFEIDLLIEDLKVLKSGSGVEAPLYDFACHTRSKQTIRVEPTPLILVEGILCFHYEELLRLFDSTIFIYAPDELRYERRLRRDVAERGRTAESVEQQWRDTVHPMHQEYCAPTEERAKHVIYTQLEYEHMINSLISDL